MLRFVIVGSGRSGSGYIAKVLTAAGVPCGHEAVFSPKQVKRERLVGDSSWCALAPEFAGALPEHVWLQTRHPLGTISSFDKRWDRESIFGPMKESIVRRPMPESNLEAAMACWVDANRTGQEVATTQWKLEDVDAELVVRLGAEVGLDVEPAAADAALSAVSTTHNRHGPGSMLTWADLPKGPLRQEVEELATSFGYPVTDD